MPKPARTATSARDAALVSIDASELPGIKPGLMRLGVHLTDPREIGLAAEMSSGVVRHWLHLCYAIEHYSGRRIKQIEPLAVLILALAIYQLRFLDRIPDMAAVNEAVEQAKRFRLTRAAGFVNAVLRRATRETDLPLPDKAADAAGFAHDALGCPDELFALARTVFKSKVLAFCEQINQRPPVILRLMPGVEIAMLAGAGGPECVPHEKRGFVIAMSPTPTQLATAAREELAFVQDPTSAAIVPMLGIAPGARVLDRCAGRGTKSRQLLERMQSSTLVAVEPSEDRRKSLAEIVPPDSTRVKIAATPWLAGTEYAGPYDLILIDAPCSNSGVLARRPQARFRQTQAALKSLEDLQGKLMEDSYATLAPGGRLVYSTCSIWSRENESIVQKLLDKHDDLKFIDSQRTLPSLDPSPSSWHDGGFYAVLERAAATEKPATTTV